MKIIRITVAVIIILPVLLVFGLAAIIIGGLLNLLHLRKAADSIVHFLLTFVVYWIFFGLGVIFHVEGKENLPKKGEKVCYVPNHQSMVDIPAVFGAGMWSGVIAKAEVKNIPLIHGLLYVLHCITIKRTSPRDSIKAIHDGIRNIENGIPMTIFPEGTRSRTGEIAAMKAGSFKMATRAKAKVVPVVLKNTRDALESADSFRPVHVYVSILPAIDTVDMDDEEIKELHNTVEERIRKEYALLPDKRGRNA